MEGAHDLERLALFAQVQLSAATAYVVLKAQREPAIGRSHIRQLMNSRVASATWRMDAISTSAAHDGVSCGAASALLCVAARMAGLRSHNSREARCCPSGINRWQAETSPFSICCR